MTPTEIPVRLQHVFNVRMLDDGTFHVTGTSQGLVNMPGSGVQQEVLHQSCPHRQDVHDAFDQWLATFPSQLGLVPDETLPS